MASVYLGLGSNIDPARNLPLAIGELRRRYSGVKQTDSDNDGDQNQ